MAFLSADSTTGEGGSIAAQEQTGNHVAGCPALAHQENAGPTHPVGPADLSRQKRAEGPGRPAWVLERGRDTTPAPQDQGFDVIRSTDFQAAVESLSNGTFPSKDYCMILITCDTAREEVHAILDSLPSWAANVKATGTRIVIFGRQGPQ